MTADPPIRPDNLCAVCRGPRKLNLPRLYKASATQDPFCSTGCARAWHGCELPIDTSHPGPNRQPRRHGTESMYREGCRCTPCRDATNIAQRRRRAARGQAA